jgi:hypothetical protein
MAPPQPQGEMNSSLRRLVSGRGRGHFPLGEQFQQM